MLRPNLARAPLGVGAFAVRPVSGADTSSTAVRSLCLALFARVGNAANSGHAAKSIRAQACNCGVGYDYPRRARQSVVALSHFD